MKSDDRYFRPGVTTVIPWRPRTRRNGESVD